MKKSKAKKKVVKKQAKAVPAPFKRQYLPPATNHGPELLPSSDPFYEQMAMSDIKPQPGGGRHGFEVF